MAKPNLCEIKKALIKGETFSLTDTLCEKKAGHNIEKGRFI